MDKDDFQGMFKNLIKGQFENFEKLSKNIQENKNRTFVGESGAGSVKVTINGMIDLVALHISDEYFKSEKEKQIVIQLLLTAFADAKKKLEDDSKNILSTQESKEDKEE